jgi:UDP-2,3-diacylglucosamine pyrophosphatase LpxH/glycosyltransferase involved in cell wall biosynthesis
MRIDIVTDTYLPDVNGVAMTLGKLVGVLRKRNHKVHIIHTAEVADINKGETKVKSIPLPSYSEVRIGLPSYMKLKRRWQRKRPDAIYVATESPLGVSALKAANAMDIPVAAGFHTNFHQYMKRYRLSLLGDVAMKYLKRVHNKADLTLTPSMDSVEMLRESGFKNVHLLGRGVDTACFSPKNRSERLRQEWGADGNTPVVIIVGRVAPEKNLDFALGCIQRVQEKKGIAIKTVLVGDGPSRKKLNDAFPDVHFAGMQKGDQLGEHYASSDIMVFASETETFGNVLLEAMASGLVGVSYNYAASKIYVKDGENGFHAEKGNEQEFEEKLEQAVDHWQNSDLKRAAEATVRNLSWTKVAVSFEGHLRDIIESKPAHKQPHKPKKKLKLRSLFLSDIHLGCPETKTKELIHLLKSVSVPRIYLNGDIIDCWALKAGKKWTAQHTKVIRVLLKKMDKEGVELIYLRGNHDDMLDSVLPIAIGGIKMQRDYVHETLDGKKYLVIHGDGFDSFSTKHKWVAKIGAVGYDSLLVVNRFYNRYRKWKGKEPYSVSKAIKAKVKGTLAFVEKYQEQVQKLAGRRNCHGIIVGHIHTPADSQYGDIHYLNCGDWVETGSCVVEYPSGKLAVLHYSEFCSILKEGLNENIIDQTPEQLAIKNHQDFETLAEEQSLPIPVSTL